MRQNTAEILKTNSSEGVSMEERVSDAQMKESNEEVELQETEEQARSLELLLQQIQVTHEKKEESERKGKETSEKIQEVSG